MNWRTLLKQTLVVGLVAAVTIPPLATAREPQVGEKMAAVELYWATREPEDVARRAHALAELVAGRTLEAKSIAKMLQQRGRPGRWMSVGQGTELKLKYVPEFDELRVINRALADLEDAGDIGEKRAIELADQYLQALAGRNLIDVNALNMNNVQVGYAKVGAGVKDESFKSEQITEYRITLRHEINGVQLANAGMRLAIHASGKLAGIRLGGVSARGIFDGATFVPGGEGHFVERRVSDKDTEVRFRESIPKEAEVDVAWARMMYVMPDDTEALVVEPMRVYSYTLQFSTEKGERVSSRRKIVGYSLTEAKASAFDFTAPAEQHDGQDRTRTK